MLAKVATTELFARLGGENLAFSLHAGVLFQTKVLMELVVVTVFRDAGIVSNATYSALVLVAFASTALTTPLSLLFMRPCNDRSEASGRRAET